MSGCACGANWGGYNRCHCSACHRTFSGLTYFDMHRRYGKCVDPGSIKKKDGTLVMRFENDIWRAFEDYDSHPGK